MCSCRCTEAALSESDQAAVETERADRSLFMQELLLSTLAERLNLDDIAAASATATTATGGGEESAPQPAALPPALPDSTTAAATSTAAPDNGGNPGPSPDVSPNPSPHVTPPTRRNMLKHLDGSKKLEKEPPPHSVH